MIDYLLDTNAAITLLNGRSLALVERVTNSTPGTIGIPTIVAHELYFGAFRSQRVAFNLENLRLLFADFPTLDFTMEDARNAGQIRSALLRHGTPIGPYDILVAAQSKARNLTLVTNNTSEFACVDGLRIEDWTR